MCYLRFSPDDYQALTRLCRPGLTFPFDLTAFKQFLLLALCDARPALAERIAGLGRRQVRVLHDHFAARAAAVRSAAQGHGLGPKEMRVLREACRCYPATVRFLWPFRANLVNVLQGVFPALAEKVRQMSDEQFRGLHEQLTRRKRGSA
jgi:hypothetical protein